MGTLVIMKGLPGCGKSTWARDWVNEAPNRVRVNKDEIRKQLEDDGDFPREYSSKKEKVVNQIKTEAILMHLEMGSDVVMDDTNLNPHHEKAIIRAIEEKFGKNHTINIEIKWMAYGKDVDKCIELDMQRMGSEGYVGEQVIRDMAKKWLKGASKPEYNLQDTALPSAYIFDIDGTLAILGDRSPYDASKCSEDKIHDPVVHLYDLIQYAVGNFTRTFILSGREEVYRKETEAWLRSRGVKHSDLIMRPKGDYRKDSVVKKELACKYILPYYNVQFVIDDRNQVVDMWRKELKIPCFQVWYGDF